MARAIDKRIMLDLIIEAKKTDPETGPFSEWLAEYLVDHLPTLIQQNEWVSVEDTVPDPGERVFATDGIFVGEAYRSSANSWFRHTGFGSNPGENDFLYRRRKEMAEIALTALRPVSREQVEKVWRGKWELVRRMAASIECKCPKCQRTVIFTGKPANFCEKCGSANTDEAVEMVMERINKMEETKK